MNQQILIYTEEITNRIIYIFDFIWKDFSDIEYNLTTDLNYFKEFEFAKINFSNHYFSDVINLKVDDILLEIDVNSNHLYEDLNEIGRCFYWLSRYEEYIASSTQFDEHQRFLGSNLDYSKPIVDHIILDLQSALKQRYSFLNFKERNFIQLNTHDVDFSWKYKFKPISKSLGFFFKHLLKGNLAEIKSQVLVLLGQKQDPYDQYNYLKHLAQKHNVQTLFFWLLADRSTFDRNYHWQHKEQQILIKELSNWADVGIHPSYESNVDEKLLLIEKNRLETILNHEVIKSRNHFIKLQFPSTYQQLLINGILEDYTMGFAHKLGFRAGTSSCFKWFDLTTNKSTLLTIYPFVIMDVTLKNYLKLTPEKAIEEIAVLKKRVKAVNGMFITLFHQSNLDEDWSEWKQVYESIFND